MSGILSGVKVLSFALQYPGPYCTLLLADMGAEVIIVERPGIGDPVRAFPLMFEALNRNKKSITINLRSPQGREICYQLAKKTDIVIEGFRPGLVDRLQIGYRHLKKVNPSLIYLSISGYGQDGPYRDRVAHDITYQGIAGMLAPRIAEGDPLAIQPVPAVGDLSSGMFAAVGALAALWCREKTGKGQYIDVSMADGLVSWMGVSLCQQLNLGQAILSRLDPAYGVFETKDKKYLTLSVMEDHFWRNLCNTIGKPELAELSGTERMARKDELVDSLRAVFLTKTRDEWVETFSPVDVPAGPVYTLDEVITDPQLKSRQLFLEVGTGERKLKQVAHPLKFSTHPASMRLPPPKLGEHTAEILHLLGYADTETEELRRIGAV